MSALHLKRPTDFRPSRLVAAVAAAGLLLSWSGSMTASAQASAKAKSMEKGRLRLEVTLEKEQGGDWEAVDPARVFETGDRLRFRLRSNFGGYLYVTNQGTSGQYSTLFPTEEAGTANLVEAGREYQVPETDGAFRMGGPAGHDIVYWMLTPEKIAEPTRYKPLPPAPAPGPVPFQMMPRCDETILRARGECLDPDAGLQSRGDPDTDTFQSRQLVFVQHENSSIISAPEQLGGPVVFEFRIAHR